MTHMLADDRHVRAPLAHSDGAPDLDACAALASTLAAAARRIAMRHFRTPIAVETKTDLSPVTLADRSIEAELKALIEARAPDHGIFGEEHGAARDGARLLWVIDPIDGTKSFVSGLPLFGTLVALLDGGTPVLGMIDMPALSETWLGRRDKPTTLNGRPCRTRDCRHLRDAVLYTTSPEPFRGREADAFSALGAGVRMTRFGGDCYSYGLLAAGHVDLVCEVGLQPYDYLPLVPVITGAGGVITDWNGEALTMQSDGRVMAAATPDLHAKALDAVRTTLDPGDPSGAIPHR